MGRSKNYSISADEDIIEAAKSQLTIGEKLSPIISSLLEEWTIKRKGVAEE